MKSNYDIIWLNSVDSTNEEAKRRISELDNLTVLSALSQTKGRGQRTNTWLSEPGKNLLFSIILKYAPYGEAGSSDLLSVQAYDQQVISQITSLAVVDLLAAHDIEARIKWPNDIYVGNKKICGILIENTVLGKWMNSSIIGVGLNVNQMVFDAKLPNPTSMVLSSDITEEGFSTEELLKEYMQIFIEYINRFCHITGGYNRLDKLYTSQLVKKV